MKQANTYRTYLLTALIGIWHAPAVLNGQDCFNVNIVQSKAVLFPNGETSLPENGDTLFLPCTKAIESFYFHIDFKGNTEKFFEDSTQFQATLAYSTTTYILSYNKTTNAFALPAISALLFDSTYSLTVSAIMCPQTPPTCDNCTITYTFVVQYTNDPDFSVSIQTDPNPAILTCLPGSAVSLGGTAPPHSGFSGQWSRLVNLQYEKIPGATATHYVANMSGTYLYMLEGPAGCAASNFAGVSPPQFPQIGIDQPEQPLNACTQAIAGISVANGGSSANLELNWTTSGSGILVSGSTTLDPVIAALGPYTLVANRLDNGCADTATVLVVPGIIPTVIAQITSLAGTDILSCQSTALTLQASASLSDGTPSAFTYLWSDGTTSDELTVQATGIYSVTVTSSAISCQGATDFAVFEDVSAPDLQIIRPRDTVCTGESIVLTAFSLKPVTYQWQNNATTGSLIAVPNQSGPNQYTVTVTASDNGCTNSASVQIERLDAPQLSCLQNDLALPNGSPITLDCPNTGTQLIWLAVATNVRNIPASGEGPIVNRTMTLTNSQAPGTVDFAFYAKNAGCTSDRVDVLVTILPEGPDGIFVPELVTPNGDGLNDTWEIALPSTLTNPGAYRISVFDRHGALVEESTLAMPIRAENYPDGTYYYVISKPDGSLIRGAVTILRRQ